MVSGAAIRRNNMSNGMENDIAIVDLKLEVVAIPVADVDRSKRFYTGLGWRLDADFPVATEFRVVQFTPPGSRASIHFGTGITDAVPGSAAGLYLVVSDIQAARDALRRGGADVSEIFYRNGPGQPAIPGRDPEGRSYRTYASFKDPDGNTWILQEITQRLEGRQGAEVAFTSAGDVEAALRRAAAAHGEHEKITGTHDENWPEWYAQYMAAEQSGRPLPR
jgi:catechol 2,3-dioxygenase-like lactoylglutathione lyase family enzyme